MSLKERVREWLKETTNKVVISLITAGVLAVLGLIYANKNIYAAKVWDFLFMYWKEILLILLTVALVWLFMKIVKLEKKNLAISAVKTDSVTEEIKKQVASLYSNISKQESTLSSLKTKIESVEDDVLDLKRAHLYQKAHKHEQLGQRGSLLCRLEVVKLDIEDGNDYHLDESLKELYSLDTRSLLKRFCLKLNQSWVDCLSHETRRFAKLKGSQTE